MAKVGQKVIFHGAYGSKAGAVRAEKRGEFVLASRIRGNTRYLLLSSKGRKRVAKHTPGSRIS